MQSSTRSSSTLKEDAPYSGPSKHELLLQIQQYNAAQPDPQQRLPIPDLSRRSIAKLETLEEEEKRKASVKKVQNEAARLIGNLETLRERVGAADEEISVDLEGVERRCRSLIKLLEMPPAPIQLGDTGQVVPDTTIIGLRERLRLDTKILHSIEEAVMSQGTEKMLLEAAWDNTEEMTVKRGDTQKPQNITTTTPNVLEMISKDNLQYNQVFPSTTLSSNQGSNTSRGTHPQHREWHISDHLKGCLRKGIPIPNQNPETVETVEEEQAKSNTAENIQQAVITDKVRDIEGIEAVQEGLMRKEQKHAANRQRFMTDLAEQKQDRARQAILRAQRQKMREKERNDIIRDAIVQARRRREVELTASAKEQTNTTLDKELLIRIDRAGRLPGGDDMTFDRPPIHASSSLDPSILRPAKEKRTPRNELVRNPASIDSSDLTASQHNTSSRSPLKLPKKFFPRPEEDQACSEPIAASSEEVKKREGKRTKEAALRYTEAEKEAALRESQEEARRVHSEVGKF